MRLRLRQIIQEPQGFNPRICKRCDGNWIKDRDYFNVSIHASVKDATKDEFGKTISSRVSIHASVKDATSIFLILVILIPFQSTHL